METLRQYTYGLLHCAAPFTQFAWPPIEIPQAIQNRAPYPELGVGSKLYLLRWIKLLKGIYQPEYAGADQIFHLHMLRQAFVDTPCDELYNR